MTDRELVTALRAGDRLAAGQMYDIYGTRLYAYCHELLGDHKMAGDALRDTFIVGVNRIRELRRPDELGAWLYAIARGECIRVGISEDVPLDAGDAARGDRLARLALDCYAMLAPETREVLDLAFRHRLVDTDLSQVLALNEQETADRVSKAQSELENTLLVVLAARTGDPKCPDAAELGRKFEQLDGRGIDAWLQTAARHVEKCTVCAGTIKSRRPLRLFEELPHSFMPPGVRSRVLETLRDPAGASFATRIAERAGQFDEEGFPVLGKRGSSSGRKWVLPLGFAAAIAAVGVVGYLLLGQSSPTSNAAAGSGSSATASTSATSTGVDLATGSALYSPTSTVSSTLGSAAATTSSVAAATTSRAAVRVCSTTTVNSTVQVPVNVTVTLTISYTPTPTASSTPTTSVTTSVSASSSPSVSPMTSVSCTTQ